VISGAGACRPGVILDRRASSEGRAPVALVGKVYCKVDATYAPCLSGKSGRIVIRRRPFEAVEQTP
jgi:hypothetical protein